MIADSSEDYQRFYFCRKKPPKGGTQNLINLPVEVREIDDDLVHRRRSH